MKKSLVTLAVFLSVLIFSETLVLFPSYGLLELEVDNGFEVPADWMPIYVSALRWNLKDIFKNEILYFPAELPEGEYEQVGSYLKNRATGEIYKKTDFGVAKVLETAGKSRVLELSERAQALFQVPGSYRIYYTLKGKTLEQFFEINSPVDSAYVILSSGIDEGRLTAETYALKTAVAQTAEESVETGRKIFVLGQLSGLKNGINLKNKTLNVQRTDWNLIELPYTYTHSLTPAVYSVEIKADAELPAGELLVYSEILGKNVPIFKTYMQDINKEGEILLSKSWQISYSWSLTKYQKMSGKFYVSGQLVCRGIGDVKVRLRGKNINLQQSTGFTTAKKGSDLIEITFKSNGSTTLNLSFSYDE